MSGPAPVQFAEIPIETGYAAAITLKTAIDAHLRWKDGLENHVHGVSEVPLTWEAVAADDRCQLGKWIHGPGNAHYGHLGVFCDLVRAHAHFHRHAAEIVASLQRNDTADATERLQVGDYPRASAEVKVLLAMLYAEAFIARPPLSGAGRLPASQFAPQMLE